MVTHPARPPATPLAGHPCLARHFEWQFEFRIERQGGTDPLGGIVSRKCATPSGARREEDSDDVAGAARELLRGLLSRPWGHVSPSIYETGRVVSLTPWLAGHARRVRHILDAQRPDGMWGAPGAYAVVPTLSAVEALLTVVRGLDDGDSHGFRRADGVDPREAADALGRSLPLLLRRLPALDFTRFPDMPANDLIVDSLVGSINRHLDELDELDGKDPVVGPVPEARLGNPKGLDGTRLAKMRAALTAGAALPDKMTHALEVTGDLAREARTIRPGPVGAVGASPAATAAWLGERGAREPRHPARLFLEAVSDEHAGAVPCGAPITVFERAWVLSTLARTGIVSSAPPTLLDGLAAALGPTGTPAAEGLPADADTTSAVLYALGLLGKPRSPEALWAYETPTHFCTWPGEEGFSVTVNAHVLEAFGQYLRDILRTGETPSVSIPRYTKTVGDLVTLLCDQQRDDGSWTDRWHASPYYATLCCVAALSRFGGGRAAGTLARARAWVLDTQRPDGSWGLWAGTVEETAYALQILLPSPADAAELTAKDPAGKYKESITRGYEFLPAPSDNGRLLGPALWHDKDLYLPVAVVRASVLAARHLAGKYVHTIEQS
ncbi:hypothetical protein FXF68_25125 [Actinomadura decatromicini]|uniref:Squalene cyclase C-terminal domain-containing protein n=1 Tax=Actinomadura decatromicini TaxID=2604572 RepID=A0A5D3FEN9_9ACTN|nr:hypothetical protein FXF68_25125 [Actinomadura decatromicini]